MPLYIVAGGGGTALQFKALADFLADDQPVYVLQAPLEISELNNFPTSIEEIAGTFIEELLRHNPVGPYSLAGHCIGGIIAFEMARQLQDKGKKVNLLAIFDAVINDLPEQEQDSKSLVNAKRELLQDVILKMKLKIEFQLFLLRKHPKHFFLYKLRPFTADKNLKNTQLHPDNPGMEVLDCAAELYLAARKKYRLQRYPGEIFLFYATDRYYFTDASNNIQFKKANLGDKVKNRWKAYGNSVLIHEIEGDHANMLSIERASKPAKVLQSMLDDLSQG